MPLPPKASLDPPLIDRCRVRAQPPEGLFDIDPALSFQRKIRVGLLEYALVVDDHVGAAEPVAGHDRDDLILCQ